MENLGFIVVAVGIIGFGMVSERVNRSVFTPPMLFALFGFLAGPRVLGLVHVDMDSRWIHTLAELTLVLVLFTDASRIDLGQLRREHGLPVRMLSLGLPLTIVLGAGVALLIFPEFSVWQAAVLSAILAPTDAALGQAVVSSSQVPVRIRQALNVESGLNDGVMLPVLLILLSVGCAAEHTHDLGYWVAFTGRQVVLGPLVGIAVGWLGGYLVELGTRTKWMSHTFQQLSALGLALLAFSAAELVGGNGFIAAFCAGLVLGNACRTICSCLEEFAEAEGQLLTLLIFLVFGVALLPVALDHWSVATWGYALLSLTLVRMLPVALSLLGSKLKGFTVLFLGWFGPRGIASILFALLVLEDSILPGREQILAIVLATVALSIVLHGASAYPGAAAYARRVRGMHEAAEEHRAVPEMPLRLRF